jgi:hypothetical protein
MLTTRELSGLMKSVADVVKDHVGKTFKSLSGRLDEVEKRVDSGLTSKEVALMIRDAVAAIPALEPEKLDYEAISRTVADKIIIPDNSESLKSYVNELFAGLVLPESKDGVDGKDALQIDVLPVIDFEQKYQRGTWAIHDGGLWRAHSNTIGQRGWECAVRGISSLESEWLNDRTLAIKATLSDGTQSVIERQFPVVIDRGVFKESETYYPGDGVTWGGSWWLCQVETQDKPGASDSWRLAVKKGRDAAR